MVTVLQSDCGVVWSLSVAVWQWCGVVISLCLLQSDGGVVISLCLLQSDSGVVWSCHCVCCSLTVVWCGHIIVSVAV